MDHALAEAHDPELGARPLKRYLERHLVSRLSAMILREELPEGSAVVVDWSGGDWAFRVTRADVLGRTSSCEKHSAETLESDKAKRMKA